MEGKEREDEVTKASDAEAEDEVKPSQLDLLTAGPVPARRWRSQPGQWSRLGPLR